MIYILLFLLSIIIFSPLGIDIRYSRNNKGDKLILAIKILWGVLKIPVNIEKTREEMDPRIPRTIKKADPQIYLHLASLLPRIKSRVKVKELKLQVDFSLGDAALTGMAAGFLWSLSGGLLALLKDFLILKGAPVMAVKPRFTDQSSLEINLASSLEVGMLTVLRLSMALAAEILKEVRLGLARYWHQRVFLKTKEG